MKTHHSIIKRNLKTFSQHTSRSSEDYGKDMFHRSDSGDILSCPETVQLVCIPLWIHYGPFYVTGI